MTDTVGKPIMVGDVLSKSTDLLLKNPALLIPQAIVLVVSLLEDLVTRSTLSLLELVLVFVSLVISIIVTGAYPSMVRAVLDGGRPSVTDSLKEAYGRFWTLLVAGILVGLIVLLGFVALVVPGIIFVTWYAYAVPAIMLERKGAIDGMTASKAFGRDKKWSTFLIFVVIIVVGIIIAIIQWAATLASPVLGNVVLSVLSFPLDAWISVIFTYAYITYGPTSVPANQELSGYGVVPPAPTRQPFAQPGAPVVSPTSGRFCSFCGSPIEPGSKFCSNCGNPL